MTDIVHAVYSPRGHSVMLIRQSRWLLLPAEHALHLAELLEHRYQPPSPYRPHRLFVRTHDGQRLEIPPSDALRLAEGLRTAFGVPEHARQLSAAETAAQHGEAA